MSELLDKGEEGELGERFENDVQIQTTMIQESKSRLKEAEAEKLSLDGETKDLHRRKVKLSSEVCCQDGSYWPKWSKLTSIFFKANGY